MSPATSPAVVSPGPHDRWRVDCPSCGWSFSTAVESRADERASLHRCPPVDEAGS